MKNFTTGSSMLLCLCLSLASCSFLDDDRNSPIRRDYKEENANGGNQPSKERDSTCIVAVIDYPQGYDWRKDSLYGNVSFNLILYANQKKIIEIPSGTNESLSPDADRHLLIDGHLYSYGYDGMQTVISKDGEEVFRYEGQEYLYGFVLKDGDIHTLGQDKNSVYYRINGELHFSESDCNICGYPLRAYNGIDALYEDNGSIFFAYCKNKNGSKKWYLVRDGESEVLDCGYQCVNVFSARMIDGQMHMVIQTTESQGRPTYRVAGSNTQLGKNSGGDTILGMNACGIIPNNDRILIKDIHTLMGSNRTEACIWDSNGKLVRRTMDVSDYLIDGYSTAYLCCGPSGEIKAFGIDGKLVELDEKAKLMANCCAIYHEPEIIFGASPLERGHSPFVWRKGRKLSIPVNGFILGVELLY